MRGFTTSGSAAVYGRNFGVGYGVHGRADSTSSSAVFGENTKGIGVYGRSTSGTGVNGLSTSSSGVSGTSTSSTGVSGSSTSSSGVGGYSVNGRGVNGVSTNNGFGVSGFTTSGSAAVYGQNSGDGHGVHGRADSTGYAVYGQNGQGIGVYGMSTDSFGVYGVGTKDYGVYGKSSLNIGVYGEGGAAFPDVSGKGVTGVFGKGSLYGVHGDGTTADFWAENAMYGNDSSIRWKKNIVNITNPLDKISNLRGVYFDWDEAHGGKHTVGFIAEEVGEVMPEVVIYEENGIYAKGMDYSKMTPLLVEAANAMRKEYQDKFIDQEARIESLESQLNELKSMLMAKMIDEVNEEKTEE